MASLWFASHESFPDASQNVNSQIEYAAKVLAADPKLAGGFNAIGFSQGMLQPSILRN